jgi:hypothetical protein
MAKKHRRNRARRNPPIGGIAKKVFSGVDVQEIMGLVGGMVSVKTLPRFIPVALSSKLPQPVLEAGAGLLLGFLVKQVAGPKVGNAVMAGALAAAAVGLVSTVSGGRLGLDSALDLEGAGMALAGLGQDEDVSVIEGEDLFPVPF